MLGIFLNKKHDVIFQETSNMELLFWKHVTWYSEFSTLCKHNIMLVKIWNVIFSWCLPFTKLECFIEENSMNTGKIPSLSSQNILYHICECLWMFLTSTNIVQIFQYLHNRNMRTITNISRERTYNYSNYKNHLHYI